MKTKDVLRLQIVNLMEENDKLRAEKATLTYSLCAAIDLAAHRNMLLALAGAIEEKLEQVEEKKPKKPKKSKSIFPSSIADEIHDAITDIWNCSHEKVSSEEFSEVLEVWNEQHKELTKSVENE